MKKFMKALFSFLLVFGVLGTLVACGNNETNNEEGTFKSGTYEGTGQGFKGEITATVTVTSDEIMEIELDVDVETAGFGDSAADKLAEQILSTQSLAVEVVSGATYSSEGIIEAVTAALEEAGADIEALQNLDNQIAVETDGQEGLDVDIAVVGSGGAGLTDVKSTVKI
jgi:fumarate reductase flavoprotein subunit